MIIAICVPYSPAGGSFTRLTQLLADLPCLPASRGHTFVLFAQQSTLVALQDAIGADALATYRIVPFRRSGAGMAARMWREEWELPAQLRRERVDVALCTANTMPRRTSIPCVVLYQNAAPFCGALAGRDADWQLRMRFFLLGRAIRRSARRAEYNVFTSNYLRDAVLAAVPEARSRSAVVGVPSTAASPRVAMGDGIPERYLLFVGHFYPYRHIVELLEAFDMTGSEPALRDYRMVLVGGFRDPAYSRRIHAAQKALAFPDRVMFIGEQSHDKVVQLIGGARCFVFLSTCESSPQALTEAVSLGCPVLTTRAGVMPEVSEAAALYCDPGDVAGVAAVMRRVMESDSLCNQLAAAGRARSADFPDRAAVAARILAAIERVAPLSRRQPVQ